MKLAIHVQCAALVVALSLGACGSGDSPSTAGDAPAEGRYAGETSQGLPISFVVTGNTVRDISFGWRARCADGQIHSNMIALPGGEIRYGVFSSGGGLETGGIAHVDGKLDGARAFGEVSRSRGSAFGTDCRATGIDWSADVVDGAESIGVAS